MDECKIQTCSKICVKEELGSDDAKWGSKINLNIN